MLDLAYLDTLAEYFASGDLAFDFEHGDEERLEPAERRGDAAEQPPPVTDTLGVAQLDAADRSVDDAYRRAETALRRAQRDGRNRVVAAPAAPQQ